MKKYLITLALCVFALTASAQVFTAEQIERYAKDKYGDNWTEAAGNLSKEVALDNKNRLNYQEVTPALVSRRQKSSRKPSNGSTAHSKVRIPTA